MRSFSRNKIHSNVTHRRHHYLYLGHASYSNCFLHNSISIFILFYKFYAKKGWRKKSPVYSINRTCLHTINFNNKGVKCIMEINILNKCSICVKFANNYFVYDCAYVNVIKEAWRCLWSHYDVSLIRWAGIDWPFSLSSFDSLGPRNQDVSIVNLSINRIEWTKITVLPCIFKKTHTHHQIFLSFFSFKPL